MVATSCCGAEEAYVHLCFFLKLLTTLLNALAGGLLNVGEDPFEIIFIPPGDFFRRGGLLLSDTDEDEDRCRLDEDDEMRRGRSAPE